MSNNILIAGFANLDRLNKRQVSWSGSHLQLIKEFTAPEKLSSEINADAIAYLTGRVNTSQPAHKIIIQNVIYDKERLILYYNIKEQLNIASSIVWKALRLALSGNNDRLLNLPFCALIDKTFLQTTLDDEDIIYKLKKLTSKNDWNTILQLFPDIENIENLPHLWNNRIILNSIAFAAAKLSETTINVRHQYPDENQRKKFLNQQAQYRKLTLKLRKRLIELNPHNPAYHSNLAYTHYQHCIELSTPGGRRDGNLKEEAKSALKAFDNALELDPNRITDSYRKGRLLIRIIAPNILFSINKLKSEQQNNNHNKEVLDLLKLYFETNLQGIETLKNTQRTYETIPTIDEKSLIRYKKEYIKALYNISYAYSALVPFYWNYLSYLNSNELPDSDSIELEENSPITISKIQGYKPLFFSSTMANKLLDYITNSQKYIEKCIFSDTQPKNLPSIILEASQHGTIDAVYKLYNAAKINLKKYFLLRTLEKHFPSLVTNIEKEILDSASLAEQSFKQALKVHWQPDFARQSKAFIAEKLARLYIDTKRYTLAIKVLEPFLNKKIDYYIRYTCALAALLESNLTLAKTQISRALQEKRNPDPRTGDLLLDHINKKLNNQ